MLYFWNTFIPESTRTLALSFRIFYLSNTETRNLSTRSREPGPNPGFVKTKKKGTDSLVKTENERHLHVLSRCRARSRRWLRSEADWNTSVLQKPKTSSPNATTGPQQQQQQWTATTSATTTYPQSPPTTYKPIYKLPVRPTPPPPQRPYLKPTAV